MQQFKIYAMLFCVSSVFYAKIDVGPKTFTVAMSESSVNDYHKKHDLEIKNIIAELHRQAARSGGFAHRSDLLKKLKKYQQKKNLYLKVYAVDAQGNQHIVASHKVPQYHGITIPVTIPDSVAKRSTKYVQFEVSPIKNVDLLKNKGYGSLVVTHEHPFKKIHAGSKQKMSVLPHANKRYAPKSK